MQKLAVVVFSVMALAACGKSKSADSDKAGAAAPAAGSGNPDDIVCCEYQGVKGSSTNKLCAESKGTVVAKTECPGMK